MSSSDFNSFNVSLLILVGLTYSVGAAIGAWSFIILCKDWRKVYILKRRRVFMLTILICLHLNAFGFTILTSWGQYVPNKTTWTIYFRTYEFIFLPSTMLAAWTIICRIWIFYYDSKISEFETNKEWRMAIDPIKESNNWFVNNINKFGNSWYLFKICLIISILQSAVFITLYHMFDVKYSANRRIFSNSWYFCCLAIFPMIGIYIGIKISKEVAVDNLGILKELIYESVLCIVFITTGFIPLFFLPTYLLRLVFAYYNCIFNISFIYLIVPHSKRLFDKYASDPVNLNLKKLEFKLAHENQDRTYSISTKTLTVVNSNGSNKHKKKEGWKDIVSTYDGYVAFMNHLGKEFSQETLLFIQEVTHSTFIFSPSLSISLSCYTSSLCCVSSFFFLFCFYARVKNKLSWIFSE